MQTMDDGTMRFQLRHRIKAAWAIRPADTNPAICSLDVGIRHYPGRIASYIVGQRSRHNPKRLFFLTDYSGCAGSR